MTKSTHKSNKDYPLVSLLVAMRNEARFIERCLSSIFAQDYPADRLEVFTIDGSSKDASWETVERLIEGHPNHHLISNPDVIQAAAWNLGIKVSHGDVIGIVSAHSELAPAYVAKAVETLQRTGAEMVGGPVQAVSQGMRGEAIALAMSTPFGVGGARFRFTEREEETDTVFMGVCSRSVFEKIGGFDEEMVRNQDDELSYRLLECGGHIVCNPAIQSRYNNRSTFRSLWRQYFQYGYWKVRVMQKHPRQMRSRQFVPPVFVGTLLFSALLTLFYPPGWFLPVLVAGSYILANLTASLWTAGQRGWKYLPLLPVIYGILHFSYGLGFLAGLVKFINRWRDKYGKVPGFKLLNHEKID